MSICGRPAKATSNTPANVSTTMPTSRSARHPLGRYRPRAYRAIQNTPAPHRMTATVMSSKPQSTASTSGSGSNPVRAKKSSVLSSTARRAKLASTCTSPNSTTPTTTTMLRKRGSDGFGAVVMRIWPHSLDSEPACTRKRAAKSRNPTVKSRAKHPVTRRSPVDSITPAPMGDARCVGSNSGASGALPVCHRSGTSSAMRR